MRQQEGLAFPAGSFAGPKTLRQMPCEVLQAFGLALKQHMAKAYAGQPELSQAMSAVNWTLALHRVFRAPYEPLLFEKEALALAHRLLTGQRPGFASPHPEDVFDEAHGPLALQNALELLKARKLLGHKGKVVVVLEEKRPLRKESFEALSQAGAADMPWVLLLAREGGAKSEGVFLPQAALAAFFGSLGFGLWPLPEGAPPKEKEEALRQAKAAHKAVVVHIKLGDSLPPVLP